MRKKYDVVCAGIATWDTLLTGIDRDLMRMDGMFAESVLASPGGDAVNAAVSMARLGLSVAVCALLGEDRAGDMVVSTLNEEGADTSYLTRKKEIHTAAPVLLVDKEGERHIIRIPDNGNMFFTREMVSDEVLEQARHLHFASANVMGKIDGKPLGELFQRAHELGLTTSMDASYDKGGKWMENIRGALENCDIFIPSLQEASVYAGSTDLQEICSFFRAFPLKCFGVKLGKKGVLVTDFQETSILPSLYQGTPVDTTGAGDAFLAGFTAAWLRGYDLVSCGWFGNAQAYSVLRETGACRSAGTYEEALDLLEKHNIRPEKRKCI